MTVAILGWGSLLWEVRPEFDQWHESWQYDGPSVKLEFSRVSTSRSGALTLVIDPKHGSPVTVAYCISKRSDPEDVIRDLQIREDTTPGNIGHFPHGANEELRDPESYNSIALWAQEHEIDYVVWTNLASNFEEYTGRQFSIPDAMSYLRRLNEIGREKAREYVRRAPRFVRTNLRDALRSELSFAPALSSASLIELAEVWLNRFKNYRDEVIAWTFCSMS
jgi:hypothetical protein